MKIHAFTAFLLLSIGANTAFSQGKVPIENALGNFRYHTDIEGNEYDLIQMVQDTNIVFIDFYADWCGPCVMIKPSLEKIWQLFGKGENGVYILGMDVDRSSSDKKGAFASEAETTYPIFPGSEFAGAFGITSIPTFWSLEPVGIPDSLTINTMLGIPRTIEEFESIWIEHFKSLGFKTIEETGGGTVHTQKFAYSGNEALIELYPNPMKDYGTLSLQSEAGIYLKNLTVFSSHGQKIKDIPVGAASPIMRETIQLPVHDLAPGTYYIQLNTRDFTRSLPFVIH